ncbi:hypothetical protein BGZ76_004559 [Entomortierella beljakovae]|nr:hypothetical protein BGZ76_004559 [Entomortierella beljakovae]
MVFKASQLSRLRHPCMLEVVEPVDESRTAIAFATEPIFASLSNLLGNYEGMTTIPEDIRKFELDELEVQKGLLQLGKGLQFCHNDAKIVHGNLVPDAIFVNSKGDWKIAGFGFSTFLSRDGSPQPSADYWNYDHELHPYCQRDLNYQAPEYVLEQKIDPSNDMFGIGCLAYSVLNKGTPVFQTRGNMNTYRGQIEKINQLRYENLPSHLADAMTRLITREPSMRMNALEFQSSKFFDNILVSTMKYMESFAEKTRDDKSQFMKGLLRVLSQFPERVLFRKILPCLLDELKDHALLPYTLPNVFYIVDKMTPKEFEEKVLPALKPIFLVREPMQNLLTLLEKIELLHTKASGVVFKEDIMPLVYCALEPKNPPSVQEKALKTVPGIMEALDYTTVKASLFPRISMATLQVYQEMGKHVDKEVIGNSIIPHLWNLALGPNLRADQFEIFMSTIQELSNKVHQQHLRHLQDLKKLEDQTKSYTANSEVGVSANGTATLNDFEKLVQGGSGSGTVTPSSNNASSSENPFKISTDNPFNGKRSQDSFDMFGDMTSSLPTAASRPMSFTSSTPAVKPSTPTMFGATSAEGFNTRPLTPTSNTQQSYNGGLSSKPATMSTITPTPTAASSPFTIPPLNKPLTSSTPSSSFSSANRTTFSQPQQKPAGTPPLSHTLGNLSSSTSAFGGFQTAAPMAGSIQPMAPSGMGGFQSQQNGTNGNMAFGMGMSTPTLTPARSAGMMPLSPMTPLQPTSTGNTNFNTQNASHKGKNSDLGMFDPFS